MQIPLTSKEDDSISLEGVGWPPILVLERGYKIKEVVFKKIPKCSGTSIGLRVRQMWVQITALPLTGFVTLRMLFGPSEPHFFHLQNRNTIT